MAHSLKRYMIVFTAFVGVFLCLFASGTSFIQIHYTVYAEEEDTTKKRGYSLGDSGDEIKWIQESLNIILDTGLEADGEFGESTEAALKEFQGQHGMKQSGIADRNTMELLRQLRKKAEKSQPQTTEAATEKNDTNGDDVNVLDEIGKAIKEQTSKPPIEIKEHLFRSYWSDYFTTLKNLIFDFKATIQPILLNSLAWLGICCIFLIIYVFFAYEPKKRIKYINQFGHEIRTEDVPASYGDRGCFFRAIGILTLIYIIAAPFKADIFYIMTFSDAGIVKAVIITVFLVLIKIIIGLIAGCIVLYVLYSIIRKISEDIGQLSDSSQA